MKYPEMIDFIDHEAVYFHISQSNRNDPMNVIQSFVVSHAHTFEIVSDI